LVRRPGCGTTFDAVTLEESTLHNVSMPGGMMEGMSYETVAAEVAVRTVETGEVIGLDKLAERLTWRDNVLMPHEPMMPRHAYVAQLWKNTNLEVWDAIALLVAHHPQSYDGYFRAITRPIRYLETGERRYWETIHGGGRFLNRCTLDSVEPPRRVDQGAEPIPLREWGASLPWWPRDSGYGEWRKVGGQYVFDRWEGARRP
jgi:hypothetical protein